MAADATERSTSRTPERRSDYLVGIGLLILVVFLWTGSNFLTSAILTSGWDKPFAVTYANTASFTFYLVPFVCAWTDQKTRDRRARKRKSIRLQSEEPSLWVKLGFVIPESRPLRAQGYTAIPQVIAEHADIEGAVDADQRRPPSPDALRVTRGRLAPPNGRPSSIDGRRPVAHIEESGAGEGPLPPLTLQETAVLAAQFTLVWFAANWSLNAGLGMTSVASGTTLSSASGFFTLGLGSLFGVERFSKTKLLAVVISFAGVLLVTQADSKPDPALDDQSPRNAILGDFLALFSAFCYAVYVTLLKFAIRSEERVSMVLFFGFVGAFSVFGMWPVGLILHLTKIEPFAWPADGMTWLGTVLNMLITFVSDFAYLLSMLKTAPLVATVGLSLTIPLAVAIDLIRGTHSGGGMADIGSLAVLLSFVVIGLDDNKEESIKVEESIRSGGRSLSRSRSRGRSSSSAFVEATMSDDDQAPFDGDERGGYQAEADHQRFHAEGSASTTN